MNQSSAKSPLVILLLVAAVLVAMNRIAQSAPLADWWLVLVLLLFALIVAVPEQFTRYVRGTSDAPEAAVPTSAIHVYEAAPSKKASASSNAEVEDDYGRIRDTEARADIMASATHMDTLEAQENEGVVENVMAVGATGTSSEVDEIAGAPAKSVDRTATQEMRAASSIPDDLTVIEGIGPKMAGALQAYGITSYTRLSSASVSDLETAIKDAGMRFAPSMSTWAEQATYAARGDWDGLKTFQGTLKGGRRA